MAVNQNYVGAFANPITETRVGLSMSGPALAKKLGLSRQYLSRAEQGTYSSLNPTLLKWVANQNGFSVAAVESRYEAFQNAQRRATLEKVNPHKLERHDQSPGGFLFERWRSGYWTSPLQFAVAFCVHPDSVQKYEEGITRTMPRQLRAVLIGLQLLNEAWEDEATGSPVRRWEATPFL